MPTEIKTEPIQVVYIGTTPQCPYCEKPTNRTGGSGTVTSAYYPPIYDKSGVNINPDRNIRTSEWHCTECKNYYTVAGNNADGYFYKH